MAVINHTYSFSYTNGSTPQTGGLTISEGAESNLTLTLAPAASNESVSFNFKHAKLNDVNIFATNLGASTTSVTLETNSTGSPTDTLTITPGIPSLWVIGSALACPFTGDCSVMFFSNPGAVSVTLNIGVGSIAP